MSTPNEERPEPTYEQPAPTQDRAPLNVETSLPSYNVNNHARRMSYEKSSDGDGTMIGDLDTATTEKDKENLHPRGRGMSHLTVPVEDYDPGDPLRQLASPTRTREQANRLNDDLALLQVERQVSKQAEERSRSRVQGRSRTREGLVDEFDVATNPVHEQTQAYKPVENPASGFGKFVKKVHASNWIVRYVTYIAPITFILLVPLLLGALLFQQSTVGGVYLVWFMIWLEIVWLTLWLGRIIAKLLPWPIGLVSSLFTNNSKKWRDMGKQLELPATLFFWWLAIEVSFLPTLTNHQQYHDNSYIPEWMVTMNKVLVSVFVGAILNFVEKIIIQLIAISFHLRTYADRIELNKFQIGSLTKLYSYSKQKIAMEDDEFEAPSAEPGSGARTPGKIVNDAAKTTKEAFSRFGDIAGKVAGDFTGKAVQKSTHPSQVILALLNSVSGSQVLARRLYRTFGREDTETVFSDDLKPAFDSEDEANAAFTMFDKDLNGDISMEELEAVCVEIGRERKSITASLKDLDSVVAKLDDVFMFLVAIITILVFISLISTSAAGVLTSAGSTVLALSWLFSATAQEFLQSCIFVFIKHPFDVGDRVTIYGNTGASLKGDDYFVKEISLLFTEFKKMEGHIVQAPNSYLNTLFILNQRRSGGLAEAITLTIKFGTTLDQIEGLRAKLLEFVRSEKREFQDNILTELRNINDVYSLDLNVVFFYKSNWQNEGLRLARRNKFLCALMVSFQELGIEGPQMRMPGQRQSFPVYLQNVPNINVPGSGHSGTPDNPDGITADGPDAVDPPFVAPPTSAVSNDGSSRMRRGSILQSPRTRGESIAAMNKRVDFSLGMQSLATSDLGGDVYEDRARSRVPIQVTQASQSRERAVEQERLRSQAMGRTTSRDYNSSTGLMRSSTDKGSIRPRASLHRNRFFRKNGDSDLELMESGMADIPENPATGQSSAHRIDPRSGTISPAAWRLYSDDMNVGPATQRRATADSVDAAQQDTMRRARTDDLEMRRFLT